MVQHKRKEKLASYDKYFKKFEHSKALDAALDVSTFTSEVCLVSVVWYNVCYV